MQILRPDDFHVHFRQGPALAGYVNDCAAVFGRALVMPNTLPPIVNSDTLCVYRSEIEAVAQKYSHFEALMTFKIMNDMSPEAIPALKAAGAIAGKFYPQGATTNSADGIAEIEALFPLFSAMEKAGLVLCLHGEDPKAFSLDREAAFLPKVEAILKAFPQLRVVLEHVTSAKGIEFVLKGPKTIAASITVHHLLHNLDDMLGGHLNPHLFCKPLLKRPEDQAALRAAVFSADTASSARIFFGSDSAPHPKMNKECDCGAAGVYSMPVALPLLAELFANNASVAALEAFTSINGCQFYGLAKPSQFITLEKRPWLVPKEYHGVVPLAAGTTLNWQISSYPEAKEC